MNKTFLIIICLLFSCNQISNNVSDNFIKDFENNRWFKKDTKNFDFIIDDELASHKIEILFSHIHQFQISTLPIKMQFVGPTITKTEIIYLKIRDAEGNQVSNCVGDICDYTYALFSDIKLDKGNYSIKLTSEFKKEYIPNVLGLGVKVSKNIP